MVLHNPTEDMKPRLPSPYCVALPEDPTFSVGTAQPGLGVCVWQNLPPVPDPAQSGQRQARSSHGTALAKSLVSDLPA